MRSSRALARGAVLVLATGTAACGVASVASKVELRDAMAAIAEARSASFILSLPSSEDDVRAFLTAAGEDASAVDDAVFGELLAMDLTLAHDGGDDAENAADDAGLVRLRIDGEDYAELRSVDEVGYLRVDLPALSERFPEMADDVDQLSAELETADLGALEPAVEAVLAEDWVSVDMGGASWLAEQQRGVEQQSMPLPDDLGQRLLDLAGEAMSSTVSIRKDGADETGDRLVATANTRELYAEVADDLPALLSEVAPGAEAGLPPASEVPSQDVSVTFWVDDGALRRVELDLAQFLDEPAGSFVIRADIDQTPSIEAPKDAVEVDLEELFALSGATPGQLLGDLLGGAGGAGVGVEAAAIAVDQEFRAYAGTEGVAPTVEHLPMVAEAFTGLPAVEVLAVDGRVQVTFDGETACLTLAPDPDTAGTITPGPC